MTGVSERSGSPKTAGPFSVLESKVIRRTIFILAVGLGLLSVGERLAFIASPRGAATDFSQDYLSARAFNDGLDPYTDTGQLVDRYFGSRSGYYDLLPPGQKNPHPPAFVALNLPLAHLPYKTARVLWLAVSALLTAIALGWFARTLGASQWTSVGVGIGGLAIPVVQTDLVYGQVNGVLLLLLLAAWVALRKKRDNLAGVSLGFAAALKLFPLLMILLLLRQRRFRAAIWQLATAGAVTVGAVLVFGLHTTVNFIEKVSPSNLRYWRAAPMNLSLIAIPFRWLTRSTWRPSALNSPFLAWAIALGLFAACVFFLLRAAESSFDRAYWLVVPWMLLATPLVWESYLVLLLPLLGIMIVDSLGEGRIPRLHILIAMGVVAVGLLPGLPHPLATSAWQQLIGYSLPTYGLIILAINSLRPVQSSTNAKTLGMHPLTANASA